jgi:hypothetical protein
MASRGLLHPSPLNSICVFCRARPVAAPFATQVRYTSARKNRKNENIVVQLTKDVPRFGAEGNCIDLLSLSFNNRQVPLFPSLEARCGILYTQDDKLVTLLA